MMPHRTTVVARDLDKGSYDLSSGCWVMSKSMTSNKDEDKWWRRRCQLLDGDGASEEEQSLRVTVLGM